MSGTFRGMAEAAGALQPERSDPAVRRSLSGPGLRTFLGIAAEWGLSVREQRALLGHVAEATYHKWKSGKVAALSYDQLQRISLVLGIYKALALIFVDEANGLAWLRGANSDTPFGGLSPLAFMLGGGIDEMTRVRRYLDAWRGGWS